MSNEKIFMSELDYRKLSKYRRDLDDTIHKLDELTGKLMLYHKNFSQLDNDDNVLMNLSMNVTNVSQDIDLLLERIKNIQHNSEVYQMNLD